MRKIRMLKSDERLGFKEDEMYTVCTADYDPDKLVALKRIPDGKDGEFSVYKDMEDDEWEFIT